MPEAVFDTGLFKRTVSLLQMNHLGGNFLQRRPGPAGVIHIPVILDRSGITFIIRIIAGTGSLILGNIPGLFCQFIKISGIGSGSFTVSIPATTTGDTKGVKSAGGTITISGGEIRTTGGKDAAGIGGGRGSHGGTTTISGGTILARGGARQQRKEDVHNDNSVGHESRGQNAAAIGGGYTGSGGTITISGGTVVALGSKFAAGIGGGMYGDAGTIKISGGVPSEVLASEYQSSQEYAMEGSGIYMAGYYIYTYDWHLQEQSGQTYVYAEGMDGAANGDDRNGGAGIGSGRYSLASGANDTVSITGGFVEAFGGRRGAGIGDGDEGGGTSVTVGDGKANVKVNATGGEFGAGIGNGDSSEHEFSAGNVTIKGNGFKVAKYDDKGNPTYESSTTVNATGGEDACGIGGGDYAGINDIVIEGAIVTAEGARRGAGIGGGPNHIFQHINITNSRVTALGGFGAGIGTGAASLMQSNPTRTNGGEINITNCIVSATSANGGAGIGGGIFGHANKITISGGAVTAQGGMFLGPGTITNAFIAEMVFEKISDAGADFLSFVPPETNIFLPFDWIASLIGVFTSDPDIIYYTGAGIGGGYHEASGEITIADNAIVKATAGVLPPNELLKRLFDLSGADEYLDYNAPNRNWKSAAIGNGAGYNGSGNVSLYDPACVLTTQVELVFKPGASAEDLKTLDLDKTDELKQTLKDMLDAKMTPEDPDSSESEEGTKAVQENNFGAVLPIHGVSFDANATDATGTMKDQFFAATVAKELTPNAFQREGYTFVGWATSPNGKVVYTDGAKATFMGAGTTTLYAIWKVTAPEFRTHSLLLDGSLGVLFYMELPAIEGVDYNQSYMEFSVSGKDGVTTTDPFDAQDMNDAGTYHAFTCYVSSIQMADTITATFHYGDGQTVSQNYSVAQYVHDFDERLAGAPEAFDETTVNLVHAMADYGHYMQPYLSNLRGWSIGGDHAEMPACTEFTEEMRNAAREGSAPYAIEANIPEGGQVEKISMSLDLMSSTTLYIYAYTDGADVTSITLADGTALPLQKISDGKWRAAIKQIMAHWLGDSFTVQVTTAGGTSVTTTLSACSFGQLTFTSEKYAGNVVAYDGATSLWRYYDAARSYWKAHDE